MTAQQISGWSDDHEDDADTVAGDGDALWERPRQAGGARFVPRIGVSGAPRDTVLALVTSLVAWCVGEGFSPLIITHDHGDWESATHLRHALTAVLDATQIIGIAADTEATTVTEAVATELLARCPDVDVLFIVASDATRPVARDPATVHYALAALDPTTASASSTGDAFTADFLIIHTPETRQFAARDVVVRAIIAGRRGLPTAVADCTNGPGLVSVFRALWEDVRS